MDKVLLDIHNDVDLNGLDEVFKTKLLKLLDACHERGLTMTPVCGVRTPMQQAALWRQSRSRKQVENAADMLRNQGAPYLADCLIKVGPQNGTLGAHVTKALPGQSWHQYKQACDMAWLVDGKINWSLTELVNGQNGYKAMCQLADDFGLYSAGANWGWDFPHIQLSSESTPMKHYGSMANVDKVMKKLYS